MSESEKKEQALLVAVDTGNGGDTDASLDELSELAKTAGAQVAERLVQPRESFHPATYIGKGKVEQIRQIMDFMPIDVVICDDELSPAQMKNLSDMLGVKVIDRTMLILDIFAAHARTSEGKLQVELAQLRYRSSHLMGMGQVMSRLGGGIGTRGPGETRLETDRRQIRERISVLDKKLKNAVKNRDTMRAKRIASNIPTIAIVGYTNAGKSTLINYLTDANVLSEDKLFATLDTTTRLYEMQGGQKFLFIDTVGFINKLPHTLIKAFRSTLEEAGYADLLLHVVDVSNPVYERQMETVYNTLAELNIADRPVITAFNKSDIAGDKLLYAKDSHSKAQVSISALRGEGIDKLITTIDDTLNEGMKRIKTVVSFAQAGKLNYIRDHGKLISEEYKEDGIYIDAKVPVEGLHYFR